MAAVFPNTYYLGMSNLGFHFLLRELLNFPNIGVERFFYTSDDVQDILSLETQTPLRNFHLILFSVSTELDFLNLLQILSRSKISPIRKNRSKRDPLIIAGGFAISLNALPLADFLDGFVIGAGENTLPFLLESFMDLRLQRTHLLEQLAGQPGFFIPDSSIAVQTPSELFTRYATHTKLNTAPITSVVLSPYTEFASMFLLEVARGCPHQCKFCFVSHNLTPWRWHSFEAIKQAIISAIPYTRKIGIVASALPPASVMNPLLDFIQERKLSVGLSSLRINDVSEKLIQTLVAGGQYSITLAPECGSEQLRFQIGKPISNEEIFRAVQMSLQHGIKKIKLYFMVGLPEETEKDVEGIVDLMSEILKRFSKAYSFKLSAGIGIFTPRPGTPFSDKPFCGLSQAAKKVSFLRREFQRRKLPVQVSTASPTQAALETLLGNYNQPAREILIKYILEPEKWRTELRQILSVLPRF